MLPEVCILPLRNCISPIYFLLRHGKGRIIWLRELIPIQKITWFARSCSLWSLIKSRKKTNCLFLSGTVECRGQADRRGWKWFAKHQIRSTSCHLTQSQHFPFIFTFSLSGLQKIRTYTNCLDMSCISECWYRNWKKKFVYADFSWDDFPVLETSFQAYIAEGQEEKYVYTFFWDRNPQRILDFHDHL